MKHTYIRPELAMISLCSEDICVSSANSGIAKVSWNDIVSAEDGQIFDLDNAE